MSDVIRVTFLRKGQLPNRLVNTSKGWQAPGAPRGTEMAVLEGATMNPGDTRRVPMEALNHMRVGRDYVLALGHGGGSPKL